MDTESAKPRINGSMLSSHMGQFVCVVGKNLGVRIWLASDAMCVKCLHSEWFQVSQDGLCLSLEASDGQKIEARFPQPFVSEN